MEHNITEEQIQEHEETCKNIGIFSALREIADGIINTEKNQMKVNLPDSIEKFESGNGEGIWATPYKPEDLKIYTNEILNEEFEVVLLNYALTFPFPWGSVIKVKNIRPEYRPVLSKDWIDLVIQSSTDGEETLETILAKG